MLNAEAWAASAMLWSIRKANRPICFKPVRIAGRDDTAAQQSRQGWDEAMATNANRIERPDAPFSAFAAELMPRTGLRAAITNAWRRPEPECLAPLLDAAALPDAEAIEVRRQALALVTALRAKAGSGGVEGLIHEYSLSSQEGVALMCLAEALLRIPDNATRDALIRDKISRGDWRSHLGHSPSLFVNAATWGLLVTGKLTATSSEASLGSALTRLIARGGEPVIRRGTDIAMRMMGEQFVTGQTIDEALANSRAMEAKGFRYSYDMLGEAAATAEDATRYLRDYENAIHAIGKAAGRRGIYEGPGISIKLSALHPSYARAQMGRVMGELLPRVKRLALLARSYDIGLNIDAEEQDRLEISLDLLEALALDPALAGWNGLGFVVQGYGRRCPFVIDWIVELARRAKRRIMVRLVKGAYWDSEIKRAQVDGMDDFPVFTRKVHTDVSYLACARRLLAAPEAVFPQFATHNAQTLAAVMTMAGPNFYRGQYEFQCLHGMGEPLYEEVVGPQKLDRPCRIYAPVGTHETLLAYLVRRLLENGANSSFVNRIADENVPLEDLVADPVAAVRLMPNPGGRHEKILPPAALYGEHRRNSRGLDLASETDLARLLKGVRESAGLAWLATPTGVPAKGGEPVRNPANHADVVGSMRVATPLEIEAAATRATVAGRAWAGSAVETRAAALRRAADTMEETMPVLIGLVCREAGKSFANGVAEVREAVDFLRYYATEAVRTLGGGRQPPLGPIACISPWNFPLAIFTGQVAAALAAGNAVLAKPAEETPLVAAEAVRILHHAGVPQDVLQLVPGAGDVGAALVGDKRIMGVMFTGSTAVARIIQRQLAGRLTEQGQPIPLIAETGGQNALIADSSALAEQVVADVVASAFDSAGQRCSALRILCLQEESADRTLAMLKGALRELSIGNPDRLATDIGPVITAEARDLIEVHVATMRDRGHAVERLPLPAECAAGAFVAPTIIEISRIADVEREVFGPVLHVLRFRRQDLDALVTQINASGFGLTFGLHTRIDETISRVVTRVEAGNIYVNRNIIGATVGVQPFGGMGLSGTGPKAGGPLYLGRLLAGRTGRALDGFSGAAAGLPAARAYAEWLRAAGHEAEAERMVGYISRSPVGASAELPGPVGERNVYALRARGAVAAVASTPESLLAQVGAILATGNRAVIEDGAAAGAALKGLPPAAAGEIVTVRRLEDAGQLRMVLADASGEALAALSRRVAAWEGAVVAIQSVTPQALAAGEDYALSRLVEEVAVSTNTAAAGGNASLMSIG
jgi:RHH-type transcriptional regulator, proline utilization regulon repressor / proline dehydrogenase / delta 1-pyrroline-5-carboxylate dehydrogenase